VSDNGIGMSPEQIPIALAAFGQVDSRLARRYEGTGLGLPLSKAIIELHSGTITIDSTPGKGHLRDGHLAAARRRCRCRRRLTFFACSPDE